MSLFNELSEATKKIGNSAGNIVKQVSDKTGDLLETAKVNSRIDAESENIRDQYVKIGEYYCQQCKEQGVELPFEIRQCVEAVKASEAIIKDMQQQLENLKEAQKQQNETIKQSARMAGEAIKNAAGAAGAAAQEAYNTTVDKVKNSAKKAEDATSEGEAAYYEAVENVETPKEDGPVCPACGAVNSADAAVCAKCGTVLMNLNAKPQEAAPAAEAPEAPATEAEKPQE